MELNDLVQSFFDHVDGIMEVSTLYFNKMCPWFLFIV